MCVLLWEKEIEDIVEGGSTCDTKEPQTLFILEEDH